MSKDQSLVETVTNFTSMDADVHCQPNLGPLYLMTEYHWILPSDIHFWMTTPVSGSTDAVVFLH